MSLISLLKFIFRSSNVWALPPQTFPLSPHIVARRWQIVTKENIVQKLRFAFNPLSNAHTKYMPSDFIFVGVTLQVWLLRIQMQNSITDSSLTITRCLHQLRKPACWLDEVNNTYLGPTRIRVPQTYTRSLTLGQYTSLASGVHTFAYIMPTLGLHTSLALGVHTFAWIFFSIYWLKCFLQTKSGQ